MFKRMENNTVFCLQVAVIKRKQDKTTTKKGPRESEQVNAALGSHLLTRSFTSRELRFPAGCVLQRAALPPDLFKIFFFLSGTALDYRAS